MTNKTVTYKALTPVLIKEKTRTYYATPVNISSELLSQDDVNRCALTRTFVLGTSSLYLYMSVMLEDTISSNVVDLVAESLSLYVQGDVPSSLTDELAGLALTLSAICEVRISISVNENDFYFFVSKN